MSDQQSYTRASSARTSKHKWRKAWGLAIAIALPVVAVETVATSVVDAAPGPSVVVYDSIGSAVPGNVTSLAFQATQSPEFGDMVSLGTGPRALSSVTVVMSSWGCQTGSGVSCATVPGATFNHPLTLNVYAVTGPDSAPVLGALLATTTQSFDIPFRPTADNVNCTGGRWYHTGSSTCFSGFATPVTFSFPGTTTLPSRIVWSMAYNTSGYGASPLGYANACNSAPSGCPYDSLNVGAQSLPGAPFAGTDIAEASVFYNTITIGHYCPGGPATIGTFRHDAPCWVGYRPMAKIVTKFNDETRVLVTASSLQGWVVDTVALGNQPVPNGFNGPADAGTGASVGSFRFGPIGTPDAAKIEMQPPVLNSLVSDFGGMQYDFQVITPVAGNSAQQFYANVYVDSAANGIGFYGSGAGSTGFYDCRYSFVPDSSVAGWNTFSFTGSTIAVNPTSRHASCGATTVGGAPPGSTIRFFRLSGGDSLGGDNGLEGAFDLVSLTVAGSTTTYDFEMETARILDTRDPGGQTVDGQHQAGGKIAAGTTYELPVAGRAGVPSNVDTVVLNVTAVAPMGHGYVTLFPCGEAVPNASNLNFSAGKIIPNAVSVRVGTEGKVCIFSSVPTDLLVDVTGFFKSLTALTAPKRLLDTRPTGLTIDGDHQAVGKIIGGTTYELDVEDRAGVPVGAATAALNVTAVVPSAPGFLTVFPCGQPVPNASNLNFPAGDVIANAVLARIGADGKVCIFSSATTDVVVDVNGYFADAVSLVQLTAPSRMLDTRSPGGLTVDGQHQAGGKVAAGSTYELPITGRASVPGNAESVVLNVTAVGPSAAGHVTVFACGQPVPNASNVNFTVGQVIPNFVLVSVGTGGKVCIFSSAQADLLVDISGYFAP